MSGKTILCKRKLKALRRKYGLSQDVFCDAMSEQNMAVSLSTIKRAESGRQINLRSARLIADYYQVDIHSLQVESSIETKKIVKVEQNQEYVFTLGILVVKAAEEKFETVRQVLISISNSLSKHNIELLDSVSNYLVAPFSSHNELTGLGLVLEIIDKHKQKTKHSIRVCIKKSRLITDAGDKYIFDQDLCELISLLKSSESQNLLVDQDVYEENRQIYTFQQCSVLNQQYWECISGADFKLPFVGRRSELKRTLQIADDAVTLKKCIACLMIGSSGIGKSRIADKITKHLEEKEFSIHKIRYSGEIDWLDSLFKEGMNSDQVNTYFLKALKKNKKKHILINIENIERFNPDSIQQLINSLLKLKELAVFVLITSRLSLFDLNIKGFNFSSQIPVSSLNVAAFSSSETELLASNFPQFSEGFRQQCVEVSQGNPLFLEQLLRGGENIPESALSIDGLIAQRVLKLDSQEKRLLNIVALCGSSISYNLLIHIEKQTISMLPQLSSYIFIQHADESGREKIKFVHGSIQKAIINNLSNRVKIDLHRYICDILLSISSKHDVDYCYQVAKHSAEIEFFEQAINYYYLAGEYAYLANDYSKSQQLLQEGLKVLLVSPSATLEIKIRLLLASVYKARFGYISPLTFNCYKRIEVISRKNKELDNLFPVLHDAWMSRFAALELKEAKLIALSHKSLAISAGDNGAIMEAYIALCATNYWLGNLQESYEQSGLALEYYCPKRNADDTKKYGYDTRAFSSVFYTCSMSLLGETALARQQCSELITLYDEVSNPYNKGIALIASIYVEYNLLNMEEVHTNSLKLIFIGEKNEFPYFIGIGKLFYGWSKLKKGFPEEAIDIIHEAYHEMLVQSGGILTQSLYYCFMTEAYFETKNRDKALEFVDIGIEKAIEHEELVYLGELYRLKAIVLISTGKDDSSVIENINKGRALVESQKSVLLADRFNCFDALNHIHHYY